MYFMVLQNNDHYGVKLPFQLKGSASGEALFAFEVSDVTFAQKLRCTLSYIVEVSVHVDKEMLHFSSIPSILLLSFTPCKP